MRTPACVGILILLRLQVFVRSFGFSVLPPILSNIPNYLRDSEMLCFIDNNPLFCPKSSLSPPYIKPYVINPARERKRYDQVSPDSVDPSAFRRPPLHSNPQKQLLSLFQYQPSGELHGSSYNSRPLDHKKYDQVGPDSVDPSVFRRPPLHSNPQKQLLSSFQHQPSCEHHGSLYNSRPLDHKKFNYEVTTVKNIIKPWSEYSILPSHSNVVDESGSTTEHNIFTSVTKPDRGSKVHESLFDKFTKSLDRFERKFYETTFNELLSISPPDRFENGISFAQSGLFLYLALMALSTEVDWVSSAEIDSNLQLASSNLDKIKLLRQITSWLPPSNDNLKFRWATRLVLEPGLPVSRKFLNGTASALRIQVEWLNGTETMANLTNTLNSRVETDSGGALRNTFEEDDFSEGTCSILLNTMYVRARWRAPPTVLNGSWPFRDSEHTQPQRSVRMIRINDVMRYAALKEWNAEAIEIRYATPGLTLVLLVPEGHTIKNLTTIMTTSSLRGIDEKLRTMRVAAIMPIYTLRMTLLLPGKLQEMGISRLVEINNKTSSGCGQLRLSHAVQRIMFWAEAGRNAYKDDGIEWDESPEIEIIVDRPYLFYVRWKNVTLMNGNFVL
ncbi:uncharacterized protein LOC123864460 isoform X2 [Maniola jurtina]|uniref:uncharacterized protein LOC123864460 isoform X2 n=1 Tax=Maniola jurtina TaxID=191418 RepID=UPI001E68C136|nr:uncharacterized protein LOC123864460 isoform X2 [Maniola jurtina]